MTRHDPVPPRVVLRRAITHSKQQNTIVRYPKYLFPYLEGLLISLDTKSNFVYIEKIKSVVLQAIGVLKMIFAIYFMCLE